MIFRYYKAYFLILLFVVLQSCNSLDTKTEETAIKEKDYFTFSGQIANNTEDSFGVFTFGLESEVNIKINDDGTFSTRVKLPKPGMLFINYAKDKPERVQYRTFARNGYDIQMTWDAKRLADQKWPTENINKTAKITGYGSEALNYFKDTYYTDSSFRANHDRFKLSRTDFKQQLEADLSTRLNNAPKNDPAFIAFYKKTFDPARDWEMYEKMQHIATALGKGEASPKFTDYENYDGSKVSLDDFKGQYVYIDVWATWCKPCLVQIPYVEALEKKYHGKNIVFVSISIDDDKESWKEMVAEDEMTGVQLFAGSDKNRFMESYKIDSIPRFILIDPAGNIVNSQLEWPSDSDETEKLLDSLSL